MTDILLGFLAGSAVGAPIGCVLGWLVNRIAPYRRPPYDGPPPPSHVNCRSVPFGPVHIPVGATIRRVTLALTILAPTGCAVSLPPDDGSPTSFLIGLALGALIVLVIENNRKDKPCPK